MQPAKRAIAERTTLFFLHYLGGSAREWTHVARFLDDEFNAVPIDLPGFGDAARTPGYSVGDMAETVTATIASEAPQRWMLIGHSMGAKVAAAIARGSEDGDSRLVGLIGLVLVAGSPPGPEPMGETDRTEMIDWFRGDETSSHAEATQYVSKNSNALPDDSKRLAIADVLRANRSAWVAWLQHGSREDWSERIGILSLPTLVIAGADDENLGPDAQRRLTVPHFADVRTIALSGAKHLLPLEAPESLACAISEHASSSEYAALVASSRVSSRTRAVLTERGVSDDPDYRAVAIDRKSLATLRAVLERVIPQSDERRIDLGARIDTQLASRAGDGWRFDDLPADIDAYRLGLATVDDAANERHRRSFVDLDAAQQDALLTAIFDGSVESVGDPAKKLTATQLTLWFEDLRADAVKLYVAHPQTLARLGYSGIANGGDGTPKSGFARVGLGEREAWEPLAAVDRTR